MQQLYTTTETQTEQTLSYAPVQSALLAEQQKQEEQSEAVRKLLAALERDTKKRQKWNGWLAIITVAYFLAYY